MSSYSMTDSIGQNASVFIEDHGRKKSKGEQFPSSLVCNPIVCLAWIDTKQTVHFGRLKIRHFLERPRRIALAAQRAPTGIIDHRDPS